MAADAGIQTHILKWEVECCPPLVNCRSLGELDSGPSRRSHHSTASGTYPSRLVAPPAADPPSLPGAHGPMERHILTPKNKKKKKINKYKYINEIIYLSAQERKSPGKTCPPRRDTRREGGSVNQLARTATGPEEERIEGWERERERDRRGGGERGRERDRKGGGRERESEIGRESEREREGRVKERGNWIEAFSTEDRSTPTVCLELC